MVEQIRPGVSASKARFVLFDFDGTVSVIRAGWVDVMVPMMVEILAGLKTGESDAELTAIVEEFVALLTGKQTMYQMVELARQVELRGGTPLDPLQYKKMYLSLLHAKIRYRLEELRRGEVSPEKYLVPGARLLDVHRYFNGGVFGALDDYKSFSKKILIQRVIASSGCLGEDFLGFGDGFVEIENVKEVGGVAVGVATAEPECMEVDPWKRKRLVGVGADFIIPNFLCRKELLGALFPPNGG
jgi:phosphoglycolate phosphatase